MPRELRICSKARPAVNMAKELTKTILAAGGKSGGHADHVCLGYADVAGTLGIKGGKFLGSGAALKIRVENDNALVSADRCEASPYAVRVDILLI